MGRPLVTRMYVLLTSFLLLSVGYSPASAEDVLELPILAAVKSNGQEVFEILLLHSAAREGYRTILIPSGQLYDPEWNLYSSRYGIECRSCGSGTTEEAYPLMTGRLF